MICCRSSAVWRTVARHPSSSEAAGASPPQRNSAWVAADRKERDRLAQLREPLETLHLTMQLPMEANMRDEMRPHDLVAQCAAQDDELHLRALAQPGVRQREATLDCAQDTSEAPLTNRWHEPPLE